MATIVTRAGKGSALTHNEVDANFNNLNNAKYESGNNVTFGTIEGSTITATTAFSGALNGTVGATTPAAGTFTSLTDSGNLTFTGTGNRILGDFSNATIASRVSFQTSTANSNTTITALPNGTATVAQVNLNSASDPTNSSVFTITNTGVEVSLRSNIFGTGTFLPMTFFTSGSERMRIDTSGNVGIGTSSPNDRLEVNGNIRASVLRTGGTAATLELYAGTTFNTGGSAIAMRGSTTGFNPNGIEIYAGGSERMRIDSSGNVGIGTSSPTSKLQVAGSAVPNINSSSTGGITVSMSAVDVFGGGYFGTSTNHPQMFYTNNAERMRITSDGNVGIGTSSPAEKLQVNGNIKVGVNQWIGNTSGASYIADDGVVGGAMINGGGFRIYTGGSNERMRIDASGNLLVNTSSIVGFGLTSIKFDQGSNWGIGMQNTSGTNTGVFISFVNSSGTTQGSIAQTNSTTTAFNTSSDYRLKENIAPMTGALETVAQLKPVTYNWKADGSDGQGFIAHELQAVVPDAVTGEKDAVDKDGKPVYQGVDTSFLVATLTAAIQELKAELDVVKAELNTLKGN